MPMRTVCSGATFGEKPPMRDELGGLGTEERRERHAVDVAAARARRRVHVAVRVDPDEAERLALAPHEVGRRRHRTGREAVVAAEHEREAVLLEHAERRLVEPLADARDLADVFLFRIAERLDFGNRRHEIAFVDDRHAERRQPLGEAGDAKRRRSHVDAAAIAAEIERDPDEVKSLRAHRRRLYYTRRPLATSACASG